MLVTDQYLPSTEQQLLEDEGNGLLRRLKLATTKTVGDDYAGLIREWNDLVTRLRTEDRLAGIIDYWKGVDLKLVERILTQTYARTVSPRINSLRQYENGTDNVYGELLPKFISTILKKDTRMTSDQVFVDLGSGVGNVVLQAALQIGCESWGCEMMENACDLAALQQTEFNARCRLWGLAVGDIHLERGDFLDNQELGKVLKRADVILVNNQAFTPELNEALTSLFLDAKEGCQIVSLKSFVPSGPKITSRNLYRACNVLDVTERRYYSSCVSWTDAPGTYYVSVKDSSRVEAFASEHA
jgi:H3 lysine-79-specific histone-lysine N-methyltransferase